MSTAAQLMPAWYASLSSTSTIFASSTTWRVTVFSVFARYSATLRSSLGIARTTTTPDWLLTTTLRSPVLSSAPPMIARRFSAMDSQKSEEFCVTTDVPVTSAELVPLAEPSSVPPVAALLPPSDPLERFCVIWPELTRVFETPRRFRSR